MISKMWLNISLPVLTRNYRKLLKILLTEYKVSHIIYFALCKCTETRPAGCGSAWLERLVWDQEVAGSNPVTPIYQRTLDSCGCSSMVEHQPSKLDTWVRFPSPAFVPTGAYVFVAQLDRATAF